MVLKTQMTPIYALQDCV